jgi:hypothetical protein
MDKKTSGRVLTTTHGRDQHNHMPIHILYCSPSSLVLLLTVRPSSSAHAPALRAAQCTLQSWECPR